MSYGAFGNEAQYLDVFSGAYFTSGVASAGKFLNGLSSTYPGVTGFLGRRAVSAYSTNVVTGVVSSGTVAIPTWLERLSNSPPIAAALLWGLSRGVVPATPISIG